MAGCRLSPRMFAKRVSKAFLVLVTVTCRTEGYYSISNIVVNSSLATVIKTLD